VSLLSFGLESEPSLGQSAFTRWVCGLAPRWWHLHRGIRLRYCPRLIAAVVAAETFEISKHKKPFNEARFVQRLHQLPDMPWSEDDDA
jgi:hypothetical protein